MNQPATTSRKSRRTAKKSSGFTDNAAVLGDLVSFVWQRKLWWLVPLLVALLLLGVLVALQATPVGPLLYPVF